MTHNDGRKELLPWLVFAVVATLTLAIMAWWTTGHFSGWLYPGAFVLTTVLSLLSYPGIRGARLTLAAVCAMLGLGVAVAATKGFALSPLKAVILLVLAAGLSLAAWRIGLASPESRSDGR